MSDLTPRLHRLDRYFTDHPLIFVTACTHNRQKCLATPAIHETFRHFAMRAVQYDVWVSRYVIMPDHIHLVAGFGPRSVDLSPWIKSLKNTISKTLRDQGITAPHWQKDFFDHVLRTGESYNEKWEYVRQNPVRAGLVSTPEEWPFQGEIHPLEWEP